MNPQAINFREMISGFGFLRKDSKFIYSALNQFSNKNITLRELELWEAMEIFDDPISLKAYQPKVADIPADRGFSFNSNYCTLIKNLWSETCGKILYCQQILNMENPKGDERIEVLTGEDNIKLLAGIAPKVKESERMLFDFKRVLDNILKDLGDKWRLLKKEETKSGNPYD